MKRNKTTMTPAEYRQSGMEADIQKGICDLLGLCGIPFSVTNAGVITKGGEIVGRAVTTAGWPDVTAVLPPDGRLLGIETKRPRKGRLLTSQKLLHPILEEAGALICVPRSIEDVARTLIAAGIKHQALTALCGEVNL